VFSISERVTQEKGSDQPEYQRKSESKSTRSMECKMNHKNSINIVEDRKSSAETSTENNHSCI